jgi:hypothetical protein
MPWAWLEWESPGTGVGRASEGPSMPDTGARCCACLVGIGLLDLDLDGALYLGIAREARRDDAKASLIPK